MWVEQCKIEAARIKALEKHRSKIEAARIKALEKHRNE